MTEINGTYLRKLRVDHNYTIRQLADLLHVSKSTISSWETNNSLRDIDLLMSLASIYGLTLDDLLAQRSETIIPKKRKPHPLLKTWLITAGIMVTLIALFCFVLYIYIFYLVNEGGPTKKFFIIADIPALIILALFIICIPSTLATAIKSIKLKKIKK